jgi:HEAT repeat protein
MRFWKGNLDMAQINYPTSTSEILAHLSDWDPRSRHEARKLLVGLGESVLPLLIDQLSAKDWHIRWEAVKALGEMKNPLAAETIIAVLQDDDTGVRWAAMGALINLGRAVMEPLMLALTEHFHSARLRHGAHHVLSSFHNKKMLTSIESEVMYALAGPNPAITAAQAANQVLIAEFPLTRKNLLS